MKGNVKNFNRLRSHKYYNFYKIYDDYKENNDFSVFLMNLEVIDIDRIRFRDKKELLKVLEFIFEKYRLYKIKSVYLSGFTFINRFTPFYISEREYIVLELILRLKEQLGGYYMKHYNFYYNIALNYIVNCKRYIIFHKILKDDEVEFLLNTSPNFFNFPGDCILNDKLSIDKGNYRKIK